MPKKAGRLFGNRIRRGLTWRRDRSAGGKEERDYAKEFTLQVGVKVVSSVLIAAILGGYAYLAAEGWFFRYIEILRIDGKRVGTSREVRFTGQEGSRVTVEGRVGRYFARQRERYEVSVVVEDLDGVQYLQLLQGDIKVDGRWAVENVRLATEGHPYGLFAVVVRSHRETDEVLGGMKEVGAGDDRFQARSNYFRVSWSARETPRLQSVVD